MKPKVGDILVYAFTALLIGLSFLGIASMKTPGGKNRVQIELDGSLVESMDLGSIQAPEEVPVDSKGGGYNLIRLSGDGVDMVNANCPDRLCVRSPRIKSPGQSIVCIPHKLIIRITGDSQGDGAVDDIAR